MKLHSDGGPRAFGRLGICLALTLTFTAIACGDDDATDDDDGGASSSGATGSSSSGRVDGGASSSSGGSSGASSSSSSSSGGSSGASSSSSSSSGGSSSGEIDAGPDAAPECADLVCGAHATCAAPGGVAACTCDTGYAGDGQICTDVDECTTNTDNCDDVATCANTDGSFTCTCPAGFGNDGTNCADVDECAAGTDDCDDLVTCDGLAPAGSFTCGACPAGYDDVNDDGTECDDIDECTLNTDNCSANATCSNAPAGSFSCTCNDGFVGNGATCARPTSCAALHTQNAALPSGVYTLNPGDGEFATYCDMTTEGGGWTMVLKADGRLDTFLYTKPIWTNADTYLPANTAFDRNEAKLPSWNKVGFSNVLLKMEIPILGAAVPVVQTLTIPQVATSMFALMSPDVLVATTLTRDAWIGFAGPDGRLQPFCNRQGFNAGSGSPVRIGITSNQENTCDSNDSFIGIGGINNPCNAVSPGGLAVGNVTGCNDPLANPAGPGERKEAGFGWVFVR